MIVPVYTGGVGLNNKVPKHRLPYDPESGVTAFSTASGVLVSSTGEVATTKGPQLLVPGEFHSGYVVGDKVYLVEERGTDAALMVMDKSASLTGVRSGLTKGQKVSYCDTGRGILYSNGYETGLLLEGVSSPWPESEWPEEESRVTWAVPPPGRHLSTLSGRVLFTLGNELHYTEYGLPGVYDEATNGEVFESDITALATVADGVYVSDTTAVYFIRGLNPKEWQRIKVLNFPARPYGVSQDEYLASDLGYDTSVLVRLIATTRGPVVLFPGGQVDATVTKVLNMPECSGSGTITVVDESIILQTGE